MILAEFETMGFVARVIFLMALPAVGLALNLVGWKRSGLNKLCALSASVFFFTLLLQGMVATLAIREAFSDGMEFWILASTGVLNGLSGLLALLGLWQVRRHHRWPRGRKRAVFTLWLNFLALATLGLAFFFKVHPEFYEKIMN
jgi:hypothetical protein